MTIPYLMNCRHSDDSWCLECVKELGEKSERDTALLRQALHMLVRAKHEVVGVVTTTPALDELIDALRERLKESS